MSVAIPRPVAKKRKPRRSVDRPYVLPEVLTIRSARELTAELRVACHTGVPLLDGSRVVEADTAGLQVLAATAVAAQQAGTGLRWLEFSPALQAAAAILGLCPLLGLLEPSGQSEPRAEPG